MQLQEYKKTHSRPTATAFMNRYNQLVMHQHNKAWKKRIQTFLTGC